jgi:hypothetical protein
MIDIMKNPPKNIGASEVVAFTTIDSLHRRTNNPRQLVGGKQLGSVAGFAIAHYAGEPGYYLFYCDADWHPFNNSWHETVEDAKRTVEFEYQGVSQSWRSPD